MACAVHRAIKIFARLKPNIGPAIPYEIESGDFEVGDEVLKLSGLKNQDDNHVVNNKPENFSFRFSKVFDKKSTQDQIFDEVARPVIDSCLLGYNGTIFAYGQTGTGKTFTITGSRNVYEDRGIIPRTLQYIFHKFKEENDGSKIRAVFVSYLEIYNECGYDLLQSSSEHLDDLVKVTLMEDGNQKMHLKNLNVHPIDSVEEATQLLYLGDHNRTIAETPLNEVSTRSHCIFTIHLNIREGNSSTVRRSKLHLVDLAGSERVSTSGITGQLMAEARHINLALHYLEQVIVALGDTNRQHIPYRNSMMTSVLRDSLGGNCMTSMIATISLELRNVQESISTCRFAQRVALVQNAAIQNEELDPHLVITQLKAEIKRLKQTLASSIVKPMKESSAPLSPEQKAECASLVDDFLRESDPATILPVLPDMRMIQECFRQLKFKVVSAKPPKAQKPYGKTIQGIEHDKAGLLHKIARRDAEIRVLMEIIKTEKQKRAEKSKSIIDSNGNMSFLTPISPSASALPSVTQTIADFMTDPSNADMPEANASNSPNIQSFASLPIATALMHGDEHFSNEELSEVKRKALATFMGGYHGTKALEALRSDLMKRKAEVESLEATIEFNNKHMGSLREMFKSSSDQAKKISISNALVSQERSLAREENLLAAKNNEIENIQKNLTTLYQNLMADFESWWNQANQVSILSPERKPMANVVSAVKKSQVETMTNHYLAHESSDYLRRARGPQFPSLKSPRFSSIAEATRAASVGNLESPDRKPKNLRKGTDGSWKIDDVLSSPRPPPVTPITPPKVYNKDDEDLDLGTLPLTGDRETDDDIIRYFRLRKEMHRRNQGKFNYPY